MAKGGARGDGETRILAVEGPALGSRHISSLQIPAALLDPSLTTTVTGTFVDLAGNPVTSGQVRFELKPSIATVIQNQVLVEPSVIIGSINSSGQLMNQAATGPCVVVQNTVLEPGGTYYEVSIWPEFIKTAVFNWFATQTNQDISASIPLPPVLPFVPTNLSGLIRIFMIPSSGTYQPSSGTRVLYVECVGGGGGGGGASTTTVAQTSMGGGGGAGGYSAVFLTPVKTSYAVTVGVGGAGSVAGAGQNGTATQFDSPSACFADFGRPANASGVITNSGGVWVMVGGIGGQASNGVGDLKVNGVQGGFGSITAAPNFSIGGMGGGSYFGGGGAAAVAQAGQSVSVAGGSAQTYGAGGGGAATAGGAAVAGGSGANGLIRVWEFA